MSVAVLPFNAGPETRPTLARQFANFAAEIVRARTGAEVHSVNYLIRIDESNPPRLANVNPSEALNEPDLVSQLFQQTDASVAMDGLLVEKDGRMALTMRIFERGNNTPIHEESFDFDAHGAFGPMRAIIHELAARSEKVLTAETESDEGLFGTSNSEAFVKFLEGYDALQYIDKTQGQVIPEFNPEFAYEALIDAIRLDSGWEAPFATLLNLCRACTQLRIGTSDQIVKVLTEAKSLAADDARIPIVLAELHQAIGQPQEALAVLEEAQKLDPNEPAIYTRMGIAQQAMGMWANAEQNFQKAVDLEDDSKPSLGFLANAIEQQGRVHEVPGLWREMVERNEADAQSWANYAASLMKAGSTAESLRAFDEALEKAENKVLVKRYYAPALSHVQEFDKAMDFYEECLDVAPADVPLLIEYAQTLQAADRTFEVPKVLRDILGANPDPNTRAQTLAWLVELEQPKRVESVAQAQEKMNEGDFEGAVKVLRPLRNWLADYWKMWALYAAALNRSGNHREAEEASKRLIELFPGNDVGFAELANALGPQGKHEEQYQAMNFGLQMKPDSLPIVLNLALAAKRLGRKEEAESIAAQVRRAVGDQPDLEPVLREIEGRSTDEA